MTQLQLGISVMITSQAVANGQMPGVEMSEDGRKSVGQYGKVLMVCFPYPHDDKMLIGREQWYCPTPTTISNRYIPTRR